MRTFLVEQKKDETKETGAGVSVLLLLLHSLFLPFFPSLLGWLNWTDRWACSSPSCVSSCVSCLVLVVVVVVIAGIVVILLLLMFD